MPVLNAAKMYYVRFKEIQINVCCNFIQKGLIIFHIIYM